MRLSINTYCVSGALISAWIATLTLYFQNHFHFIEEKIPPFVTIQGVTFPVTKEATIIVPTLEGQHIASNLDWIIKGVKGELYPCKPDIFELTHDKID